MAGADTRRDIRNRLSSGDTSNGVYHSFGIQEHVVPEGEELDAGTHLRRPGHGNRHHHHVAGGVHVEELAAAVGPERRLASVGRDLPLALVHVGEGANVHLVPSGFVRGVGQPLAVGRERRRRLVGLGAGEQFLRRAVHAGAEGEDVAQLGRAVAADAQQQPVAVPRPGALEEVWRRRGLDQDLLLARSVGGTLAEGAEPVHDVGDGLSVGRPAGPLLGRAVEGEPRQWPGRQFLDPDVVAGVRVEPDGESPAVGGK